MGQSVDHAVGRARRVFAKSEAAFNTFVNPAATDAIKIRDFSITAALERAKRIDNRSSRGVGTEQITRKKSFAWSLDAYALPSGVAGTAPDIGEVLKRAMGIETVTGGTKVDYTLNSVQAIGSLLLQDFMHDSASTPNGVLMQAVWGAVVEALTIKVSGKEEASISAEGIAASGAHTVYGTSTATISAAATSFTYAAADAGASQVGSVIKIGTDDNTGAGYTVTAVDAAGTGITFTPGLGVQQTGATPIRPFAPTETTAGSPLSATLGSVTAGGISLPIVEAELTMKNGMKPIDDEQGQDAPSDFIPGDREVTGSLKFRGRRDVLINWANRTRLGTRALVITCGNVAGNRLKINVPFAEIDVTQALDTPARDEVMVPLPFTALESAGNDEFNLSFD